MILSRLFRNPRLRGVLRVAFFLSTLNLAVTAALLPSATARAEEELKRGGLELLKQLGPELVGHPEVAVINGQRMSLGSKTTPLGVAEVMRRFERHCEEQSGGLAAELGRLPEKLAGAVVPESLRDPSRWLTRKGLSQDETAGQLACIARKRDAGGMRGFVDSVLALVETGDLGKVGDARYIVARRDEAAGYTHVLAMWTEGSFNIPAMFPETGDAPGSDSAHLPRPPAARRVLSAEITGHPFAMRMYDTDKPHDQVLSYYRELQKGQGWSSHVLPRPDRDLQVELDLNQHVLTFSKDAAALIVIAHTTPQDKTGVTLIEMGGAGFVRTSLKDMP
jgi:hypothetical protein